MSVCSQAVGALRSVEQKGEEKKSEDRKCFQFAESGSTGAANGRSEKLRSDPRGGLGFIRAERPHSGYTAIAWE